MGKPVSEEEVLDRLKSRLAHCERALCGAIAQRDHFARGLRAVRDFAQAHHGDQQSHFWLHSLIVDIPQMVETIFSSTFEETRRRCQRFAEPAAAPSVAPGEEG